MKRHFSKNKCVQIDERIEMTGVIQRTAQLQKINVRLRYFSCFFPGFCVFSSSSKRSRITLDNFPISAKLNVVPNRITYRTKSVQQNENVIFDIDV